MRTRSQSKHEHQSSHQKDEGESELVVNEDNFPHTNELLETNRHTHVKLEKLLTGVRKSSKILQLKQQKSCLAEPSLRKSQHSSIQPTLH